MCCHTRRCVQDYHAAKVDGTSLYDTLTLAFVVPSNAAPLLNGGSVAMRSTLWESNPRSTGRLSSRKNVRLYAILFLVKVAYSYFGWVAGG